MKLPLWRRGYWGIPIKGGVSLCDQRPWYGGFRFVNSSNDDGPPQSMRARTFVVGRRSR